MFFNFVTVLSSIYFIILLLPYIFDLHSDDIPITHSTTLKFKRIKTPFRVSPIPSFFIYNKPYQTMISPFARLSLILIVIITCQFCRLQANDIFIKGLYVNDFKEIIGDLDKENELLQFAHSQGFNYLALYNLGYIHKHQFDITDMNAALPLAKFIERAKKEYGILQVGAVGETFKSFKKFAAYNQMHSKRPIQQFDVFNIEFEFWNQNTIEKYYCPDYFEAAGIECTKDGAFEFYVEQITQLKDLCKKLDVIAETYIGTTTAPQNQTIGSICDRVLIHYYRSSDVYNNGNSIYNYNADRLRELAPADGQLEVLPIFSARDNHMGPWLLQHKPEQAFQTFMQGTNGYGQDSGAWKTHIKIAGYQWYRYTDLSAAIKAAGNTSQSFIEYDSDINSHLTQLPRNARSASLLAQNAGIQVYPNPANDVINIQSNPAAPAKKYRLLNSKGDQVLKNVLNHDLETIDLTGVPPGIYCLQMELKDGYRSQMVLVQR